MAISRVLRRHGVSLSVIGDIERETCKAQLLTVPEAERLASGRQFMSSENQTLLREQAAKSATKSHQQEFPEDFVYDFVEPGPGDSFEFGINYKACGFCKFAARHGDQEILPNICGLDFDAYATRGIHLERTQTLAGGASHCNFRFSRLPSDQDDGDQKICSFRETTARPISEAKDRRRGRGGFRRRSLWCAREPSYPAKLLPSVI
jgi:hypothetical protein